MFNGLQRIGIYSLKQTV